MGNFISYELLPIVFNMSVTASVAILFVLLARLLLKRAPKIFSYALWAVVLFRLLCPVSITTGFSLLGLFDAPVTETTTHTTAVEYIPQDVVHTPAPEVKLPVPGVNQSVNEALPQGDEQTAADPLKAPVALATLVWLAGIGVLAAYSVVSLLRLRQRLVGAVLLRDNIYLADYIESPFVMGILRPKIYLPSSLSEQEQGYIILHEQHHIRRGDHIIKALAFLALCVHWFNPLVWVAFVLSAKDMEMSCDEAVVKKLGEEIRADYSASLLSLATGRRIIAGTPLAFGEGDTKGRIKNLLNWKRPKAWITVLAAVVCVVVAAACAGNPGETSDKTADMTGQYASMEEYIQSQVQAAKDANTISYHWIDGGSFSNNGVDDTVADARAADSECHGTLDGLAPEGTLELWEWTCEIRPTNAEGREIAMAGGAYVTDDGYIHNGSELVVALRRSDSGRYDILYAKWGPEHTDFGACCDSVEEALYDWYVTENELDLPLYVEDWIDRIPFSESDRPGNYPVHRYDGDGWYFYIPVGEWEQVATSADTYRYHWEWTSGYNTGSTLVVNWFTQSVEDEYTVSRKQGFTPTDSTNQVWERTQNGVHETYYIYPGADGGSLRVWTYWEDSQITDYPYIAIQPDVLRLMAESFTVDSRFVGGQTYVEEQSVPVYENGEITITVPAKFADLIKVDYFGSDNMFSVKANLYYAPEYIEHDLYTPPLNGGWMLTVSTTFPDFAASIVGQPSEELLCGCWTEDGRLVYMENRPVEGFYNCEESNLEKFKEVLESIRIDYGNLTPFTEKSVADTTSTSAVPLTQEEINWFNDWFEPIVQDKQGNDIGVNPRCCFLTSYYDDVTELNFEEFMRYFPGDGIRTSEAEFEALREVDGWPFSWVESLEKMPVPVHKYPKRLVDLLLGEYAGISTADLDTSGVAYLPEYDAYYNYTSDFGPGMFVCTHGERDGDIIRLYSVNGTDLLTLRQVDNTSYQIVSLQRLESPPSR